MAVYGYTKNYKLVKPQFDSDTWHDYEYDNLDTIDAVLSAIYASGDWQGFWKTNTSYTAGSVVIDKDTDTMYKVLQDHTTDSTTFNEYYTAHPDYYRLWSPNNLAEDWAVKMDGDVETGEYSAKAHASSGGLVPTGSAKEWATGSGEVGSSGEYSAKKYATDAHNDYISMTTNEDVVAVASNINNVNAVGQSISNVNTVANNISDVNTAVLNIEAIKDAPNQAASANNSKIEAQNSANTAQTMATQAGQSATSAAQSAQTATNKADEASESARLAVSALSLQIGDVMFVPLGIDESLNLRRYLNGQVIIQSQFVSFTNKVKAAIALHPNLGTTETNWQAEKTNSKLGQCGKFVVDDTAGTIRLPAVVNAQGLVDLALIGGIKNESLPNITGEIDYVMNSANYTVSASGSFSIKNANKATLMGNNVTLPNCFDFDMDASRSSSSYQNNAPVQQEAVQYPYCIVVNTGVEESDRPINNYQVNNVYSYGMSQYYKGTMNNNSWLKSAGQWNSGTVYTGMYNWLLEQMNNGVEGFKGTTAYQFKGNTTETESYTPSFSTRHPVVGSAIYGGSPIQVLGHATQVNADGSVVVQDVVNNITATLVFKQELPNIAWFTDYDFVINTADQTFRLPLLNGDENWVGNETSVLSTADIVKDSPFQWAATKNGFVKFTCYKTNITQVVIARINGQTLIHSGVATTNSTPRPGFWLKVRKGDTISISAETQTLSGVNITFIPAVGNGSLYYYIGDTLQNAQLINVARIEEKLTDVNAASRGYLVDSYRNGTEWYRVYSDGWIEQGGRFYNNANVVNTILFIKPFKNTDYSLLINHGVSGGRHAEIWGSHTDEAWGYTTTSFEAKTFNADGVNWIVWSACGY